MDRAVNRRLFITLLGGAAASWPLAVLGSSAATPALPLLR